MLYDDCQRATWVHWAVIIFLDAAWLAFVCLTLPWIDDSKIRYTLAGVALLLIARRWFKYLFRE